jgi:hypothetical protein
MIQSHIAIRSVLLVGLAATLGTIVIHGLVVHIVIVRLRRELQRRALGLLGNLTFIGDTTRLCARWAYPGDRAMGVRARSM